MLSVMDPVSGEAFNVGAVTQFERSCGGYKDEYWTALTTIYNYWLFDGKGLTRGMPQWTKAHAVKNDYYHK